jgi:hypothetical protein
MHAGLRAKCMDDRTHPAWATTQGRALKPYASGHRIVRDLG